MFEAGDVVRFHSATVGKIKFHLCLGPDEHGGPRFAFLYVNSKGGFKGDCVLEDGDIPGLPVSRTEQSIVSFTNITRFGPEKLTLYGAKKVGEISSDVAGVLLSFAQETKVLNRREKNLVVDALSALLD